MLVTVERMVWPTFSWSWLCPRLHPLDPATVPQSTQLKVVTSQTLRTIAQTRLQLIDNKVHEGVGITHGLHESRTSDKRCRVAARKEPH